MNLKNIISLEAKIKIKAKLSQWKNKKIEKRAQAKGYKVYIGEPCVLRKNVMLVGDAKIDDYTYINPNTVIGHGVEIGKYCSISYDCHIGLTQHPTSYISTSPYTYGRDNIFKFKPIWTDFSKKTIIGNDVWIGGKAIIMQGVIIGDGAIIGGGSVVTKDVEPYSIVGGVPTRVLKYRFDIDKIEALKKCKWWDLPKEELIKYKDIFQLGENAPDKFIELVKE